LLFISYSATEVIWLLHLRRPHPCIDSCNSLPPKHRAGAFGAHVCYYPSAILPHLAALVVNLGVNDTHIERNFAVQKWCATIDAIPVYAQLPLQRSRMYWQ
jgi:hypothetical protein